MKFLTVIQARYSSTRLRGKVLMDLCGKPVLQHVVERVQKSRFAEEVFVATGIGRENLPIVALCANMNVRVFAGAEKDVLDRFYQLAKLIKPEYVIRITADCPCFDWTLLDAAIEGLKEDSDYLSDLNETLPDGLDMEIIRFAALEKSWKEARLFSEREHVTQFVKKNPSLFSLQNFENPMGDYGHLRLTLDEEEDYTLIQGMMETFYRVGILDFTLSDILAYFEKNPEKQKINAVYSRNEGLAKSLLRDGNTNAEQGYA